MMVTKTIAWMLITIFIIPWSEARFIKKCLTGYMTDVQNWVDEDGNLTRFIDKKSSINIVNSTNPVQELRQMSNRYDKHSAQPVRFMSLARCRLNNVPYVFNFTCTNDTLGSTLEYLTLYGNQFSDHLSPDNHYSVSLNATDAKEIDNFLTAGRNSFGEWSSALREVKFTRLKELDLRACAIQVVPANLFSTMPNLKALYLGENYIVNIQPSAFNGIRNLQHLDLSRNSREIPSIQFLEGEETFRLLPNLRSLDLSYTQLAQGEVKIFQSLGDKFHTLSICETGLTNLRAKTFEKTSMRLLDISGNPAILSVQDALGLIEDTLEVLIAEGIDLRNANVFYNFRNLKVLKVINNEISIISPDLAKTLTSLQLLFLDSNRFRSWVQPTFYLMESLVFLSLQRNNINLISMDMMNDFKNLTYIALAQNNFVCNCHARELYDSGTVEGYNEDLESDQNMFSFISPNFDYYNEEDDETEVAYYSKPFYNCEHVNACIMEKEIGVNHSFAMIDYSPSNYKCLLSSEFVPIPISEVEQCNSPRRGYNADNAIIQTPFNLFLLLLILVPVLPIMLFIFLYRRNFKYFMVTLRNSAMLSLINKDEVINDDKVFDYDVFVSYCNEDRDWVLDELLPHVEKDCNVSVCLHERDFQVGLSILENIVSCMDRSRSIILIISQQFLLSQWCQFEMHLAQHRLLETRREDLILVLLEEIPRAMRPNTLHYLMLTKTYIVWPKHKQHQVNVFWGRLKKSIVTLSRRQENSSLA